MNNRKDFIVVLAACLLFVFGIMMPRLLFAVTISIPTGLTGIKGKTVHVPVNIDPPLYLEAYYIEISYDPNVLYYDGSASYYATSLFEEYENPNDRGKVRIGGGKISPFAVNGVLFVLKFNVLSEAENSAITIVNQTEGGRGILGAQVRAGSITTIADTSTCTIKAIIDPALIPDQDIILSLTGHTNMGDTTHAARIWNDSDSNVVSFDVEPGEYRIKAETIGYAPFYSDPLDCDTNTAYVNIDTKLMPSYTVNKQYIVIDPNDPQVKFTFSFIKGTGVEDDWPEGYPLKIRFFNESNDTNQDKWPDPNTSPNGPIIAEGWDRVDGPNGYKVYTVTIPVKNYLMTDLSDKYVIAFRTERRDGWIAKPGEVFLDPNENEERIHRFIIKKSQLTESTKILASGAVTMNPKKDFSSKGYITIQIDPNIFINQTESFNLTFNAKDADIFHFSDANGAVDPNENLSIEVSYTTGTGAGLTTDHPGVKDPNDIVVISIGFTDTHGNEVVYNQGRDRDVSLILFDIPAPRALQDPNLTSEAIENKIVASSAQSVTPGNYYGIYYRLSESDMPELFIPGLHGGSLSIFKQNDVIMLNIGVPHASDWYIGEYNVSPTGGGGGGCFIETAIKNVSNMR